MDDYKSEHPDAASKKAKGHVWTERKAQFIARYLRSFTYVTKHGTYLDAFAGPQIERDYDNWTAKLVLENEPKWLRRFHLFDEGESQCALLKKLADKHHDPGKLKKFRKVYVYSGDSNINLPKFLEDNPIPENEAAFCLFDQRTKECNWATVKFVAKHKKAGNKVEIFYFLAQGWIDRVLTPKLGKKNIDKVIEWLGSDSWENYKQMDTNQRARFFLDRFTEKLGYAFSRAYPIFERGAEGKIMFWLIHASDHERAPALMDAAYSGVGLSLPEREPMEQLTFL